ncbi:MAG: FtsX-like permease family protein [Methanomassiliicoccales archaeon]|nr:FtsX-like permease family protein [Methanomassiliicoccales archaeon]NYT15771.1 FtsX-like permease family protein [Methanomassiliicoccales archaeon]
MTRLSMAIVSLILVILFIDALLMLSFPDALLVGIALIVVFILIDARWNRVLFLMGRRNILRRKGTTALVVCGLMVGTAIISASFVVGDTLDNMIVGETTKGSAGVDFVIESPGEQGTRLFNDTVMTSLEDDLLGIDNVQFVQSFVESSASVLDNETQLSNADVRFMGLTPGLLSSYSLVDQSGEQISSVPNEGEAYINGKLATELDAAQGDHLTLFTGNTSLNLVVQRIAKYEQLGSFDLEPHVYLDLGTAQNLTGHPDHKNILFVSLGSHQISDIDKAREDINSTLQTYQVEGFKITEDKQQSIEDGLENMATYTSLFFMLGSFSVIAGIVLIANIFTMLGEERKSEMGISRAIGMKRSHLIRVFTYEGMLYAAMAAGIGTLAGLALAYVLVSMAAGVFNLGDFPLAEYFTFTPFSLAIAYLIGFLLTLLVVYIATRRISTLNIVRAIRNIPEPPLARNDRRSLMMGIVLCLGGAALVIMGVLMESQLFCMGGLSCVTISLGFLHRELLGDRIAWNMAAIATLIIWLPLPFEIFPYEGFIELFVLAGIFMVSAALILVMFNSNGIIWFFTKILRARKGYRAVIKTAISYPLKSKFRTALSVFIFGLVIFTVTTLSVMSGILGVGIPKMAAETSGGFDIIAFTNPSTPLEEGLWDYTNTSSSFLDGANITNVVSLDSGRGLMNSLVETSSGEFIRNETPYNILGFESTLITEGKYWLADWNKDRFASEKEVWDAVLADTSLVIVDGSMLISEMSDFMPGPRAEIGDEISVTTSNGTYSFTVVGIMKQPVLTGMFVSHEFTGQSMNIRYSGVYLIKIEEGLDVDRQAALLEREFLAYGMQTIPVDTVAKEIVQQINGVFTLFRAFLGLGLIIGISGLGIITIRSIRERRLEIGMMRAIGYTKRMVVTNFALESSFISFLGIVLGSLLGISVGYTVYLEAFQEIGYDFVIPWGEIIIVGIGAFLATLLSVFPAARGASKVSPAEVLRFE